MEPIQDDPEKGLDPWWSLAGGRRFKRHLRRRRIRRWFQANLGWPKRTDWEQYVHDLMHTKSTGTLTQEDFRKAVEALEARERDNDVTVQLDAAIAERDRLRAQVESLRMERDQYREVTALMASQKHALRDRRDRLIQLLAKEHGVEDGVSHERDAEYPDPVCDLLFGGR
jgi:hypothetical protein